MAELVAIHSGHIHDAMSRTLHGIEADPTLGRSHSRPPIELTFTPSAGGAIEDAELRAPGKDEEYVGRATFDVAIAGKPLGELAVTALAPHQGTGKTAPNSSENGRTHGIIPVSRDGIDTELHLSIATLVPEETRIRAYPLVNHLTLLGKSEDGHQVITLGTVGQTQGFFKRTVEDGHGGIAQRPDFTRMTGTDHEGDRVGDATALFNRTEALQLAGTLAIREPLSDQAREFLRGALVLPPFSIRPETAAA